MCQEFIAFASFVPFRVCIIHSTVKVHLNSILSILSVFLYLKAVAGNFKKKTLSYLLTLSYLHSTK